jgi:hypothetical protein
MQTESARQIFHAIGASGAIKKLQFLFARPFSSQPAGMNIATKMWRCNKKIAFDQSFLSLSLLLFSW